MEKNLFNETILDVTTASGAVRCPINDSKYMILAVCDLEGFAADAACAGSERVAEILLATANMLRSTVPFEFSTNKN